MIINPTARGKRSEAKILSELVEAGKSVLIPWGEERYDLALDEGGRLVRIQCKTGILRGGCVDFKTCVADIRRPLGDGGYHGQIEAFAVYCPQTNKSYLVPIEAVQGQPWQGCASIRREMASSMESAGHATMNSPPSGSRPYSRPASNWLCSRRGSVLAWPLTGRCAQGGCD